MSEFAEVGGPVPDPAESLQSNGKDDQEESAPMETVALDTTDIYQEHAQAEESNHEHMSGSIDSDPGKETDLKKYFANTPTDASACSFFDSLSVSTSPMMKSVSEVSMFQNVSCSEDDSSLVAEAPGSGKEAPLEETGVCFSLGDDALADEAVAVIAQEAQEGTVQFHSAPLQEEVRQVESATSEPVGLPPLVHETGSADEKPSLSKFFSDDHSGGDQEGKAFFDVLAAGIAAGADKMARSSGSASPVSMTQEPCLIAEALSADDGDVCSYDSWLPSAATREFLTRLATSEPGTVFPDREHLTMPGIIVEEPQGDPVRALLEEHLADDTGHRRTMTADDVPQNEDGLRQLIGAQCHNAAINLTTRLLTNVGQGPGALGHPSRHSPQSLQVSWKGKGRGGIVRLYYNSNTYRHAGSGNAEISPNLLFSNY